MSIRRNTVYNLLGSIIPLGVSLVTIPIYLNLIGEARYGVLAIAWLLLGYFGIFDLGLGRATAQRIAAQHGASFEERAQTFWTALTLNIVLGIVGGLLIWPVAAYFFGGVFQVEEGLRSEMVAAVPWLVLAVPMATLSGVLTGALQGRERFLELNLISSVGVMLFQATPLMVAYFWDVSLTLLLPAAIAARMLTLLALFVSCQKHVVVGHRPSFIKASAGQLLRFGGWVTVSSFIGPFMVVLDRFIIGATSGAVSVSHYSVPFQLARQSTIMSGSLVAALFPKLTSAEGSESLRLARDALRIVSVLVTPIFVMGIIFVGPFITWWVGGEFSSHSANIAQILLFAFWFNSLSKIPSAHLQARGRPDLVAKCHLVELVPYVVLLFISIKSFGAIGAAMVFLIRIVVDFALLAAFSGLLRQSVSMLAFPVLLLTVALGVAMSSSLEIVPRFVIAVILLFLALYWSWEKAPGFLLQRFLRRET